MDFYLGSKALILLGQIGQTLKLNQNHCIDTRPFQMLGEAQQPVYTLGMPPWRSILETSVLFIGHGVSLPQKQV